MNDATFAANATALGVEGSWFPSTILSFVELIDSKLGAAEWGSRQVALMTVVVLGTIRWIAKDAYGVTWYQFTHGITSGYLSFLAMWLSVFWAESLTGTPEPLRSLSCQGPLTSLHRIVPAITMGYGIFDIIDGMGHGVDFLLHGLGTFIVLAYFCEYEIPELILPMLLMEVSTPHLNLMRFSLLSETGLAVNMGLFALTFFIFRLVICPYLWVEILQIAFSLEDSIDNQTNSNNGHLSDNHRICIPWHFKYFILGFGIMFNGLNIFWAIKIVKKIRRKVKGIEKVNARNDLKKDR